MLNPSASPKTIDEYIAGFPAEVQSILEKLRATIRAAAPAAEETISYGMPTFRLKGNLVHFAAFKNHLGFYPTPSAIEKFRRELAAYPLSKGTVRFAWDQPIPYELVAKIVAFRIAENLELDQQRKAKKKARASS